MGRSSFEEAKNEVFKCLKLGVSGTWEGFRHGRFRVGFVGADRLCRSIQVLSYQSNKRLASNGYDEATSRRVRETS